MSRFPESRYNVAPQTTIGDVFAAVQSSKVSHGVVPFENSSNGSVVFTLDLFADLRGIYPDILVCGEIYLQVHHCLLGHATESGSDTAETPNPSGQVTPTKTVPEPGKPRVKPLRDIKHVKKLYSHPQAWGQCKLFLGEYLKGTERHDVSSTSKAAELVAQDTTGTSAAISSRIAANLNGLDVLAEGIEDSEGNSTRFFVLRRRDAVSGVETDGKASTENAGTESHKTLVSFTVEHGEPGALADCLAVCKTADPSLRAITVMYQGDSRALADYANTVKRFNLNLTSINTRPSGEAPWHYIFFVECFGRKQSQGGGVNEALEELGKVSKSWRWLGSWENALRS